MKKESNTSYELVPTSNKSVQPIDLLRLSVSTTVAPTEKGKRDFLIEASKKLSSLEVAMQEGYTDIKTQGAKLSMSTDFETLIGIISAFSKYGYSIDKITLTFSEFARMSGLKPTDINRRVSARLHDSIFHLSNVTLYFHGRNAKKTLVTHLIQRAVLNYETAQVEIVGDSSLWDFIDM